MSILKSFGEPKRLARLASANREKSSLSRSKDILLLCTADHIDQRRATKNYINKIENYFSTKVHLVEILSSKPATKDFYSYKKITPSDFDIWGNVQAKHYHFLLSKGYSWIMNFDLSNDPGIHEFTLQFQCTSALGLSERFAHLYDIVLTGGASKSLDDYFAESLDIFEKMI